LRKTGIVIRDFQPSASKNDFILSCEGFSLLNPFDTRFSVHGAEFDGVVALRLSAAVAVYFVVSVMTVIARLVEVLLPLHLTNTILLVANRLQQESTSLRLQEDFERW
jgi:hypothetical protein